ncbi:MAG TPA: hypothetical protein PKA53_04650 [Sphingobacterium sp.]|nr:hypothetical protein [Sphingobacterium sp.]
MKIVKICCFLFFFLAFTKGFSVVAQQKPLVVKKIWDQGKHNAFPDLIFVKGYYYVAFREGNSHIDNTNDGQVRIIRSKNLKKWETVALFQHETADVREARLSCMPDGRILVNLAIGLWKNGYEWLHSYVSFSDQSGKNFTPIEKVNIDPKIPPARDWIWRVTWQNGIGYGILYKVFPSSSGKPWEIVLVKTKDGKNYDFVSSIPVDGSPNESTVRFDSEGKAYAMIRRESGDKMGMLGVSEYPYTRWDFNSLAWQLGGPNFLFMAQDKLVMGSRFNQPTQARTGIFVTDLKGNIAKTIELPSGGDNSYPGMVIRKDKLVVVYYSSHEGKSAIYLTKIPLKKM